MKACLCYRADREPWLIRHRWILRTGTDGTTRIRRVFFRDFRPARPRTLTLRVEPYKPDRPASLSANEQRLLDAVLLTK